MYKLTKKFRFEAAHRLAKGYVGKCANIHGHSWNGQISVVSDKLDDQDMAVDFKILGDFCKHVESNYDHTVILHVLDVALIHFCNKEDYPVKIMKDNPTSETIARKIFCEAEDFFTTNAPHVTVNSVTINETCTCSCTYEKR